ncbi:MAG: O-antigen ligase family protein [Chloroflexi bacterium]|nr:O-antigen ligase family protein [Chloroflexota bacterium]
MSVALWVLTSLIAISLIGDLPYLALVVTALAGIALALNLYADDHAHPSPTRASVPRNAPRGYSKWVGEFGWLLDVVIALLLLFPSRWMALGFFLVPLAWLARWRVASRGAARTVFNLPILLILLMTLVSLWASADLSASMIPLGQIIAGVNAFYSIVARVQTESDLYWLGAGLILLGVMLALVAPFGVEWSKNKIFALPGIYDRFHRLLPAVINGNVLAGALVPILVLGSSLLIHAPLARLKASRRALARCALAAGLLAILGILLLTQSRGGIVAAVLGLLVLAIIKTRWILAPLGLGLVGLGFWASSNLDLPRVVDLLFSSDAVSGLAGREEVWSRAIYALQDVPFTGIGLGIFPQALQVLYPLFLVGPDASVPHAHNLFLQVGVDLGIPGLIAYLAMLILAWLISFTSFRCARQAEDLDLAAVSLGLALALVSVALHGLVDAVVWDAKPSILVWMLFAVSVVVRRVESAGLPADEGMPSG